MNTIWQPIETAIKDPKHHSILLCCIGQYVPLYCGRWRKGWMNEPQPSIAAWRCDSSGTFSNPTHWMVLPNLPE